MQNAGDGPVIAKKEPAPQLVSWCGADRKGANPMAQSRPLEKIESMLPAETADKLRAAEDAAQYAGEHARIIGHNLRKVGSNFLQAARTSVRSNPTRALATAGAVGFVVGVLWKS
jgi:ElaB/YqjD/DUF883 family membrane-anchored ribosome-binding protein